MHTCVVPEHQHPAASGAIHAVITACTPDLTEALTLPEVAPGIYTLRADQVDEAGKVTSRFETPFKRETVEALAAAGLEVVIHQPLEVRLFARIKRLPRDKRKKDDD
jgi:hypothetical protein